MALREAYPGGKAHGPGTSARDVDGVIRGDQRGRCHQTRRASGSTNARAYSSDFQPVGTERVRLFSTDGSTFNLEPDRTTRIVVVDLPGDDTVVLAIEPSEGYKLSDILDTADPAVGTINWR